MSVLLSDEEALYLNRPLSQEEEDMIPLVAEWPEPEWMSGGVE